MHESKYSSGLAAHLRENLGGSVVFKHSDQLSGGIPDISATWRSRTMWLEVKIEGREDKKRTLQKTNMRRLAASGKNAFYVVYGELTTKIISPLTDMPIEQSGIYADHRLVEHFIKKRHGFSTQA